MNNFMLDRQGNPISSIEEMYRLKMDDAYRVVKQEDVGPFQVSTVWLGFNIGVTVPLIFETVVFLDRENLFEARYSTEAEAQGSHEVIKAAVEKGFALYGIAGVRQLLAAATVTFLFSDDGPAIKEDE